jgi:hypothetical protein
MMVVQWGWFIKMRGKGKVMQVWLEENWVLSHQTSKEICDSGESQSNLSLLLEWFSEYQIPLESIASPNCTLSRHLQRVRRKDPARAHRKGHQKEKERAQQQSRQNQICLGSGVLFIFRDRCWNSAASTIECLTWCVNLLCPWPCNDLVEGSLEVKLPTIWTDEKQSREEAERRERLEERRVEEKESEERRCRCTKR